MAEKEYRKLPGRGIRSTGLVSVTRNICSLYLGNDHLLQVESISGYSEEYKRFYFRDIQAITVQKTNTAAMSLAAYGTFSLILVLIARAMENPVAAGIFYFIGGVLGLIFLFQLLSWFIGGGSCLCYLQTAVQVEQLPSLKRLKTAEKVLGIVQPLIEQSQGGMALDELKLQIAAYLQNPPPPVIKNFPKPFVHQPGHAPEKLTEKPYGGRIHLVLFLFLLGTALMSLVHIWYHPAWFVALETFYALSVVGILITALVKQHGSQLSPSIQKVTWASLGMVIVSSIFGYILAVIIMASNPDSARDQWEVTKAFSEYNPMETPWLLVFLIVSGGASLLLGVLGLFYLQQWRARRGELETNTSTIHSTGQPSA
ncbi:MAG: hypothetical protein ACK4UN_09085 [Limisphaerales bacterium]